MEKLHQLEAEILRALHKAETAADLEQIFNQYFAKKGEINSQMALMKTMSNDERALFGKLMNTLKATVTAAYESKRSEIDAAVLKDKLTREAIDITLPGYQQKAGGRNPYYLILEEIENIFISLGYQVEEGPEVESDHYNFELLNIPHDHPAREMQDSFYFDVNTLLRTHTSPIQARTMEKLAPQPIKVICPGKVYRRDDDDATHSHQFAQVEGLFIDKDVNLNDLTATLSLVAKRLFGEKREIRLRSSYFPFTEPSVEVDISCFECSGKGCSLCKQTGWIEVLGAGMVHPNVLRMNGYDPDVYQGFAFGIGVERVAMLRYGIDDIRRFYQNDIRFLDQFRKIN